MLYRKERKIVEKQMQKYWENFHFKTRFFNNNFKFNLVLPEILGVFCLFFVEWKETCIYTYMCMYVYINPCTKSPWVVRWWLTESPLCDRIEPIATCEFPLTFHSGKQRLNWNGRLSIILMSSNGKWKFKMINHREYEMITDDSRKEIQLVTSGNESNYSVTQWTSFRTF
jgi:hypothetical protein